MAPAKRLPKKLCVRIPPDVKIWLQQQSALNLASQNSEIIRSIRMRMDHEKRAGRKANASAKMARP